VIADLHAHYPMHLAPEARLNYVKLVQSRKGRLRILDAVRAGLLSVANRVGNYESFDSGPRMTIPAMRSGRYGVALSVLYSPFDEMDLGKRYGSPPGPGYVDSLKRQIREVEDDIARNHAGEAAVVHSPAELDAALAAGQVALVHCVEGGFHLGGTPEEVDRNVTELARHGVAYVTLAHLFYRAVATNVNAIPFIPDWLYHLVFPMPHHVGLTELGRAAVRAMLREHVLIDLSHMDADARARTFDLLDELDPDGRVPVVATHVAYRFGSQDYNFDEDAVRRVAARDGVLGLILAEHQAADGLQKTGSVADSIAVLCSHIDRFREITGSHRHTAFGTDLDGFIKPTLTGLETAADMAKVEDAIVARYGAGDAELITSGNALRLLRGYWRGRPS
jgi:microsomal dipeptidase-like Zn-dependent dipeptidase